MRNLSHVTLCGCLALVIAVSAFRSSAVADDDPLSHITDPRIRKAIKLGLSYLEKSRTDESPGLVAYTAIKSGSPKKGAFVSKLIAKVKGCVNGGVYGPTGHHIYTAGVDIMALEAADPVGNKKEIQAIAEYLIKEQRSGGDWDYPMQKNGGDTSISQYGLLGLWAATRAGVEVPYSVWDKAAQWHIRTQRPTGGFSYHPLNEQELLHSMSAAATGSLYIARLHLYPNAESPKSKKRKQDAGKTLGVLQKVAQPEPLDDTPGAAEKKKEPDYTASTALAAINGSIGKGVGWLSKNFQTEKATGWPLYYLYALERAAALGDIERFGGRDWYREGSELLLRTQLKSGSWPTGNGGETPTNCFALLFLAKSTAKIMKRTPAAPVDAGAGLLAGGRGLPDNLSSAQSKDGKIVGKKLDTPLDELLAELANPKNLQVESAQVAIVQQIQVGNREELIKKKDLLVKLADDPRPDVRQTALWALGRCEDLRMAPLLIKSLKHPDDGLSSEAYNSLCTLSRKPLGFKGLATSPTKAVPEGATDEERKTIVAAWKVKAFKKWQAWYLRIRPYEERDDLLELTRDGK